MKQEPEGPASFAASSLVWVLIMVVIAPVVVAVLIPPTRAMRSFIVATEERIAVVVALWPGNRWIAILRIVVWVQLAMRVPIGMGGLDSLMESTAANIVVVLGWLNIPLHYLRMCLAEAAHHWHTCQAHKKYWSYEARYLFHLVLTFG